jgi:hypothetical protein
VSAETSESIRSRPFHCNFTPLLSLPPSLLSLSLLSLFSLSSLSLFLSSVSALFPPRSIITFARSLSSVSSVSSLSLLRPRPREQASPRPGGPEQGRCAIGICKREVAARLVSQDQDAGIIIGHGFSGCRVQVKNVGGVLWARLRVCCECAIMWAWCF